MHKTLPFPRYSPNTLTRNGPMLLNETIYNITPLLHSIHYACFSLDLYCNRSTFGGLNTFTLYRSHLLSGGIRLCWNHWTICVFRIAFNFTWNSISIYLAKLESAKSSSGMYTSNERIVQIRGNLITPGFSKNRLFGNIFLK